MNCSVNVDNSNKVVSVTIHDFNVHLDHDGSTQTTHLNRQVFSHAPPSVDAFRRALDVTLDHALGIGNHPVAQPVPMSVTSVPDRARDGRNIVLKDVTLNINEPISYQKTLEIDSLKPSNVAGAVLEAIRRALG